MSCPSTAGVDIPAQERFDCENNITRIILTKTGTAFTEGDPIIGITLLGEVCEFRSVNANASSGPNTRVNDTIRKIGSDLVYSGFPFQFDTRDAASLTINILGIDAKLISFSISSAPPTVATASYNFRYSIGACEGTL